MNRVLLSLSAISSEYHPFKIQLSESIGFFPNISRPCVIWVGINEGSIAIKQLHKEIKEKTNLGITDQHFSAHITLGRIRYLADNKLFINNTKKILVKHISQTVMSIDLIESRLTPNGPVYKLIKKFPFNLI